MAAYAKKHYGIHSWRLHPKVIVEHYTGSNSFSAAWNTFAANTPDPELGELPGTCAHFIVDRDGRIYQLVRAERHVPPHRRAQLRRDRHRARRHVRRGDPPRQGADRAPRSSSRAWLVDRFHIRIRNVIGHNESLSSPYHKELYKPWAHQTHADWKHADMRIYRGEAPCPSPRGRRAVTSRPCRAT